MNERVFDNRGKVEVTEEDGNRKEEEEAGVPSNTLTCIHHRNDRD